MEDRLIKIISFYEIVGGSLGVLMTIYLSLFSPNSVLQFRSQSSIFLLVLGIYFFVIILYSLSIIGGILLWKKKTVGYIISIASQLSQILYIITPMFVYNFVSGLLIGFRIGTISNVTTAQFSAHIGSTFNIYFNTNIQGFAIGVNFIPVIIIICLIRRMRCRSNLDLNLITSEMDTSRPD